MISVVKEIIIQEQNRARAGLVKATHVTMDYSNYATLCGYCMTLMLKSDKSIAEVAEFRGLKILIGLDGCGVVVGGPSR